ncbi:MAG: 30S ribosomal protein S1 [Candidatus Methylomirabilia bacterium]
MSDATDNTTQEQDEVKREVKKPRQQQGKAFCPEPAEGEDASERAEMNRLYDETLRHLEEGEIVRGRVIKITDQEVLVDVGFKSEGAIPIGEFRRDNIPAVGEEIEVFLEEAENAEGHLILSKEKADKAKIWEEITKIFDEDREIEGYVTDKIKGGLAVDIGVRGFLPGSQVDLRPVRDLGHFVGQKIVMKILKLNRQRGNVVLSRRAVLEKGREEKRRETLKNLVIGMRIKGVVKNITEYGAFIDLGGVDGLLHITDMSWGRISHPSEVLMVGEEVEVVVLKFDRETERVSLGLKQKSQDPWTNLGTKYPIGTKVKGKVVSLTDYGAFVELEEGVEGLVHVSEMSWTKKVKHPSKILSVGDQIECQVLNVDENVKRISLGIKQIESNPWDVIEQKYPIGSVITGKVRNLTEFGAFVGLDEGIDGLVHVSDISWTKKIKHPSEVLKKGDSVDAVVLNIDKPRERLSLGIKQVQGDPWQEFVSKSGLGKIVGCTVVKVTDFGVFVAIAGGIEGLIHASELGSDKNARLENFAIAQELQAKVIRIDQGERKVSLSLKALETDQERADYGEYTSRQGSGSVSIGEMLEEKRRSREDE